MHVYLKKNSYDDEYDDDDDCRTYLYTHITKRLHHLVEVVFEKIYNCGEMCMYIEIKCNFFYRGMFVLRSSK